SRVFVCAAVAGGALVVLWVVAFFFFPSPRGRCFFFSPPGPRPPARGAAPPPRHTSISVILPTFNGGDGLEPTIISLRRQSLQPLEIIVVDDGSTDRTRAIAYRAREQGLVDMVIANWTRCGPRAAIKPPARV